MRWFPLFRVGNGRQRGSSSRPLRLLAGGARAAMLLRGGLRAAVPGRGAGGAVPARRAVVLRAGGGAHVDAAGDALAEGARLAFDPQHERAVEGMLLDDL